ncbi:MAG: molybdenum cofactor guanylyltransferase [Deltaproteobacteria bacterium]|nr:molybdenum cofactor guanylyltransferase [Deltaproteobacteria bacterium]
MSRLAGVAAAILAGGGATRMGGRPKSFLTAGGRRIIDRQLELLGAMFSELLIVANDPHPFAELGLPVVPDGVPGQGPLMGVLSALEAARADLVVVVACDMPFLSGRALELVADPDALEDVVIPVVAAREEPLHARYRRTCAAPIRACLSRGERRIRSFFDQVRVRWLEEPLLRDIDPDLRFLTNCNTPGELEEADSVAGC